MQEVVYPKNPRKYAGSIEITRTGAINVRIRTKNIRFHYKTLDMQDALKVLREKNIEYKLTIANIAHPQYVDGKLDHYEVETASGKRFKCSPEDMPIVDKCCWTVSGGYVRGKIGDRMDSFHQVILNHNPEDGMTIDHINRDPSDNRRSNLRLADKATQSINRNCKPTDTGYVGVAENRQNQCYVASWRDEYGKIKGKSFSFGSRGYERSDALRLAIEYRKEIERTLPHYRKALGLPEPEEQKEEVKQ